MKGRNLRLGAAALGCAALAGPGIAIGTDGATDLERAPARAATADAGAQPAASLASTTCFSRYASGTGVAAFEACVSKEGNVVSIKTGAGTEHLAVGDIAEGYIVCDRTSGVNYADTASADTGNWAAPVVTQPNGPNTTPLTITRKTTDNRWQLKQAFAFSGSNRTVTITSIVTNLSAQPRVGNLSRYYDPGVDGTAADDRADKSVNSVWVRDNASNGQALTLMSLSPTRARGTSVLPFPGRRDECLGHSGGAATPTGVADWTGQLNHALGSVNPNRSVTVKTQYLEQ